MMRACFGAMAFSILAGFAAAQSCNTLSGGANCAPPTKGGPIDYSIRNSDDSPRGYGGGYMTSFSGSSSGGLGNELSGNYAPTTFGAISFGAGGSRCSGLFRSRSC
jgi:hypothetical protein